jgi:hypothetical protein
MKRIGNNTVRNATLSPKMKGSPSWLAMEEKSSSQNPGRSNRSVRESHCNGDLGKNIAEIYTNVSSVTWRNRLPTERPLSKEPPDLAQQF